MKNLIVIFFLTSILNCFCSCEGDCKIIEIEKVEWVKNNVSKIKDTLVKYSIEESRDYDKSFETVNVTIFNNNETYSNNFTVKLKYFNINKYGEEDTYIKDYVEILPGSSYTFSFTTFVKSNNDYKSFLEILQLPKKIVYKEKMDELKKEKISVNSCNENIEALKLKYKTIEELYFQNTKQNSIKKLN